MENGRLIAHLNFHEPSKLLTIETCGDGETGDRRLSYNAIKEVLIEYLQSNFPNGLLKRSFASFQGCHVLKQSNEEAQKGEVQTLSSTGVLDFLESNNATEILVVRGNVRGRG